MIKVVSYPADFLCAQISDGSISNTTAVYSSNDVTSSFSLVH